MSTAKTDVQRTLHSNAADFYRARQNLWQQRAEEAETKHRKVAQLRGATALLAALLLGWVYYYSGSYWLLTFPVGLYVYLVWRHAGIAKVKQRSQVAGEYFAHALSRLDSSWAGLGPQANFAPAEHPYAADLDLFGNASLFDLLCTAVTRGGQQTLAGWLLEPGSLPAIQGRQSAVRWLLPRASLREEVALLAADHQLSVPSALLGQWGNARPSALLENRWSLIGAWALVFGFVVAVGLWAVTDLGAVPLILQVAFAWLVQRQFAPAVRQATEGVDRAAQELALTAALLARVEAELSQPEAPELVDRLAHDLGLGSDQDLAASRQVAQLKRRFSWFEAQYNQLFAPIGYLCGWSLHWARSIEGWRATHGPRLETWLAALSTFESLMALSQFSYDQPGYIQPTLISSAQPVLDADALGHPLLNPAARATSKIELVPPQRLLMVSGSNMSGKSTLLRSVGINVVLAMAGSVVCAAKFRLSALQMGATLRVEDSLLKGQSRFYAEIERLRQIAALGERDVSLLFLLDEILSGTNSHDRLLGASGILERLLAQGGIGLVTTHDLALTQVAKDLGAVARNVHFRDALVAGRMHFDYQLYEGVVQQSNALALMRAIGLLPPSDSADN